MKNANLSSKLVTACAAALALGIGAAPAAADPMEFKVASLAPAGSPWMDTLNKAASDVKDKTGGRITIKYYEGGQQGDEKDFVAKIKAGQLDGAAVTAIGLSLIDESIRVLELPTMFSNLDEFDYVADKMWPYFQAKFEKKGFKLTDRGEVGWIYFMSKNKIESVADLRAQKVWQWGDDQLVSAMYKKLGINGVPLGVPDVDAALTQGRINACYGSPVAAVALQWSTKVKYMTSMPMSFALGATVISTTSYNKLTADDKKNFEDLGRTAARKLRKVIRAANEDSKATMQKKGVTIVQTPQAMVDEFTKASTDTWQDLVGKIYSKDELDMVLKYRDEYRSKHGSK